MFLATLVAACISAPPEAPQAIRIQRRRPHRGSAIRWSNANSGTVTGKPHYSPANPDKNLTVRNLGWSGDTVFGEARGRFDFNNPDKCFKQLVEQTLALKPTVIFVSYGTNESFEGKEGLEKFEKGLEKLLDAFKPANARIVLFSPIKCYRSKSISGSEREPAINERLELYSNAIKAIAKKREHHYADAYERMWIPNTPVSDNGMHLNEEGYQLMAVDFLTTLGQNNPRIAPAKLESLRKAVVEKNELFFHRLAPENETYLFGFRKHEQGKNAKEVAEFDPLVAKAEEEIAKQIKRT